MFAEIENTGAVICYQQTGMKREDTHIAVLYPNGTSKTVSYQEAGQMRAVLVDVRRYLELVTFTYKQGVIYIHVAMVGDALSELIVSRFQRKFPGHSFEGVL